MDGPSAGGEPQTEGPKARLVLWYRYYYNARARTPKRVCAAAPASARSPVAVTEGIRYQ